jgi:hypothetical protein
MNDFNNGVLFTCLCAAVFYAAVGISSIYGKREVRDQCTEYGRVEISGMKYKCTFEVSK